MSVLYIALPVALVIGGLAVWAFVYSVRQGQYDDLDTPPMRMLFDDVDVRKDTNPEPTHNPSNAESPPASGQPSSPERSSDATDSGA